MGCSCLALVLGSEGVRNVPAKPLWVLERKDYTMQSTISSEIYQISHLQMRAWMMLANKQCVVCPSLATSDHAPFDLQSA